MVFVIFIFTPLSLQLGFAVFPAKNPGPRAMRKKTDYCRRIDETVDTLLYRLRIGKPELRTGHSRKERDFVMICKSKRKRQTGRICVFHPCGLKLETTGTTGKNNKRTPKESCFKQLFPVIKKRDGELRRCARQTPPRAFGLRRRPDYA